MNASVSRMARPAIALTIVKLLHTAIWAFFVACIVALPVAGWYRRFDIALILMSLVLLECAVLAVNRGRCPLTTLAARFTLDRSPAFDIYLPQWLAKWNKTLFGTLFLVNCLLLVAEWMVATGGLPTK